MSNKKAVTIYHNPRCSKSRQTLGLLEDRGIKPQIIKYLDDTPDKATLKKILKQLGLKPRDLMRKHEAEYKGNNLDDPDLSDDELIDAMLKFPKLIERPIVLANNKAALGRPPEDVLKIL
ncbi:MAG TPA: arsenate reductase (glutaredoxin) [Chromatiales bacterium]|nr:arsenate reductase (glutaredoxin) [Thiotrichales bacterium]HIP68181.1 arsenate reductase (glutaredoxin) [Chromatiales bacterium]